MLQDFTDKRNPEFRKLQKQKVAYEARLRNRVREESNKMQADKITDVTKAVLNMALASLPPVKRAKLLKHIKKSVQDAKSTL